MIFIIILCVFVLCLCLCMYDVSMCVRVIRNPKMNGYHAWVVDNEVSELEIDS